MSESDVGGGGGALSSAVPDTSIGVGVHNRILHPSRHEWPRYRVVEGELRRPVIARGHNFLHLPADVPIVRLTDPILIFWVLLQACTQVSFARGEK